MPSLPPPLSLPPSPTIIVIPGCRISGRTYVDMIEAVTADDVTSFVGQLLNTRPVMVTYGQGVEGMEHSPLLRRYGLN